jgi:hypothetical protein
MRSSSGRIIISSVFAAGLVGILAHAQQPSQKPAAKPPLYNTAKQKLLEGKQIFSFTQSRLDLEDTASRRSITISLV